MDDKVINLEIPRLGDPRISSPMTGRFIDDCEHVVLNANPDYLEPFFKKETGRSSTLPFPAGSRRLTRHPAKP